MVKTLLRRYEQIYAPLYEWNLRQWGGDSITAGYFTALALSFGCLAAVAPVSGTVVYFLFPYPPPNDEFIVWPVILSVFFAHYVMFVRGRRHERIYDRYKQLSRAEQRKKFWLAWVYLGVSFVLIPLLAILAITLWG